MKQLYDDGYMIKYQYQHQLSSNILKNNEEMRIKINNAVSSLKKYFENLERSDLTGKQIYDAIDKNIINYIGEIFTLIFDSRTHMIFYKNPANFEILKNYLTPAIKLYIYIVNNINKNAKLPEPIHSEIIKNFTA